MGIEYVLQRIAPALISGIGLSRNQHSWEGILMVST